MKNSVIVLILLNIIILNSNGMEKEQSISLETFPFEILKNIYDQGSKVVYYTKEEVYLNNQILPQTFPINIAGYTPTLKCENTNHIRNEFHTNFNCINNEKTTYSLISPLNPTLCDIKFDGVNKHDILLLSMCDVEKPNGSEFTLYVLHQNKMVKNHPTDHESPQSKTYTILLQPKEYRNGVLKSLTLHNDQNRYVLNVLSNNSIEELKYRISIVDIQPCDQLKQVASLKCDIPMKKCIYLGKDTYLGLTEQNTLISLWLTENNEIKYAHQKCSFIIQDIDVDRSIVSKKGFMPQIAAITMNGDLYEAHIDAFEKLTWLYTAKFNALTPIKKMNYNNRQCSIIFENSDPTQPAYCYTYSSNFNMVYFYTLAKQMYNKQK